VSFRRQYPNWLYPGRSDKDPSRLVQAFAADFLLDPLCPTTWLQTFLHIKQAQPDIVIMQWWTTFWAPAFAALGYLLRRSHLPLLYLVHNVLQHEPRLGDMQLTRMALQWGQGFITWNANEKANLQRCIPPAQVELCPMPVCTFPTTELLSKQQARERLGIPSRAPIILFFGFIRPYKGLRYLLEAVARLRDAGERFYLIIAGECWENKAIYQKQIEQYGLSNLVRMEDRYIPNEEVGTYFAASDVLVAPYTQETKSAVATLALRFGVPLIISEGVALGLPAGRSEVRVVPQADPAALAGAIVSLCRDQSQHAHRLANLNEGWERLVYLIERFATNAAHPTESNTDRNLHCAISDA
jgi:D-inositol-3-phosphate glycosyltransferase